MASHGGGAVLIPAAIVEDSDCRYGGEFLPPRAPVRPAKPGLPYARGGTSLPHGDYLPKKHSPHERR